VPAVPAVPAVPVVPVLPPPEPVVGTGSGPVAQVPEVPPPPRFRTRVGFLAATVAVLLAAGFAGWLATRPPAAADDQGSLAVLPFVDLGPEGRHQYLADGMTEELIGLLGGVEGLRVVGRTSVFALRNRGLDAREIGETLGVGALVEGTVRLFDGRLRVSARLVSTETGYPLWSESYEREMADVLRMQADIAGAIAATFQGRLVGGAAPPELPGRIDPDAYHRYLQGRFLWHRRTGPDLLRAAEVLREAVLLAPGYARAHLALADAWAVLAFYDVLPPDESFPLARDAAMRALELDPGLGAAHATLGYVDLYHAWDWPRAEEAFLRAIDLEPGLSQAYQWYANYLVAMGRFPEAEFAMLRAQEFDPLSLIANAALGWVHYYAAEYDRGVAQGRRTLEIDPGFGLAYLWLGQSLERLGRLDEGFAALEQAVALGGGSTIAQAGPRWPGRTPSAEMPRPPGVRGAGGAGRTRAAAGLTVTRDRNPGPAPPAGSAGTVGWDGAHDPGGRTIRGGHPGISTPFSRSHHMHRSAARPGRSSSASPPAETGPGRGSTSTRRVRPAMLPGAGPRGGASGRATRGTVASTRSAPRPTRRSSWSSSPWPAATRTSGRGLPPTSGGTRVEVGHRADGASGRRILVRHHVDATGRVVREE